MGNSIVLCGCFLFLAALTGALMCCYYHRYRENVKGSQDIWRYFIPLTGLLWRRAGPRLLKVVNPSTWDKLQAVKMGQSKEEIQKEYFYRKCNVFLLLLFLTALLTFLALLSDSSKGLLKEGYYICREEPGGGDKEISLQVRGEREKKETKVLVKEREYTDKELKKQFRLARKEIQASYLGENASADKVTGSLVFNTYLSQSACVVQWRTDTQGYIQSDGTLANENLTKPVDVEITAILSCGGQKEKMPLACRIFPPQYSKRQNFWRAWRDKVNASQKESAQSTYLSLPQEVQGRKVSYMERAGTSWRQILAVGVGFCVGWLFLQDLQIDRQIQKRELELRKNYPEVLERFILLIGAGMTIRGAWIRIAQDYEQRRREQNLEKQYLYEEMLVTGKELENGISEAAAYTGFGRRVALLPYMKLSSLLVQNLRNGSDDLLKRMEMEAEDAVQTRRECARQMGEKASTKLLLPMMLMLVIVFAMIMIAAFQAL